eukprot:15999768-Heterocapsa_arctica.AAC.1
MDDEAASMVVLGALHENQKSGVSDWILSHDGRLAAELAEDVPPTMHKPPPRKQRRWGASQGSGPSGKPGGNDGSPVSRTLSPLSWLYRPVNSGNGPPGPPRHSGNPVVSVPGSRSSESSETSNTVKFLFKTQKGPDEDIPWVAESITKPPVLPTS